MKILHLKNINMKQLIFIIGGVKAAENINLKSFSK